MAVAIACRRLIGSRRQRPATYRESCSPSDASTAATAPRSPSVGPAVRTRSGGWGAVVRQRATTRRQSRPPRPLTSTTSARVAWTSLSSVAPSLPWCGATSRSHRGGPAPMNRLSASPSRSPVSSRRRPPASTASTRLCSLSLASVAGGPGGGCNTRATQCPSITMRSPTATVRTTTRCCRSCSSSSRAVPDRLARKAAGTTTCRTRNRRSRAGTPLK